MRNLVFLLFTFTACSCVASSSSEWVNRYADSMDRLICSKNINYDHFLVGLRDKKYIVGYRLQVGKAGFHPSPYEISWKFTDLSGRYIEILKPKKVLSSKVYQEEGFIYVDELQEREVHTKNVEEFEVKVAFRKGSSGVEKSSSPREKGDRKMSEHLVCKVKVKN